ncbi:MAG: hypothetical protein LBT99_00095 [Bifidobacteriaceae bacterium]|jgi:hypothetical protein|nr:hypothetical protein [Bifidobacteriaceae bacterium]
MKRKNKKNTRLEKSKITPNKQFTKYGTIVCIFLISLGGYLSISTTYAQGASGSNFQLPISKGGTGQSDLTKVNVGSMTKLQNTRLINGVNFDGTSDININLQFKNIALYSNPKWGWTGKYTYSQNNNLNFLSFKCPNSASTQWFIKMVFSINAGGGVYALMTGKNDSVHYAAASDTSKIYYLKKKVAGSATSKYNVDDIILVIPNVTGSRNFSYMTSCNNTNSKNTEDYIDWQGNESVHLFNPNSQIDSYDGDGFSNSVLEMCYYGQFVDSSNPWICKNEYEKFLQY